MNQTKTSVLIFTSIIAATMLSGCATKGVLPYHAPSKAISFPVVNVLSTVEIGQTIISKSNVSKIPAIKLSAPVAENINFTSITRIQTGPLPLVATSVAGKYYRDVTTSYGGIFIPSDDSKPAVIYLAPRAGSYGKIPVTGIEHMEIEQLEKNNLKKELIYSGISQNTISILYREFSDGIARPAFSQELKYDLSQSTTIGYKGARFEVIKATNTELTYKVIKPLD